MPAARPATYAGMLNSREHDRLGSRLHCRVALIHMRYFLSCLLLFIKGGTPYFRVPGVAPR
jgi:hypothetical protein